MIFDIATSPPVFGRGEEETDFLQRRGIQVKSYSRKHGCFGNSSGAWDPIDSPWVRDQCPIPHWALKERTDPLFVAENSANPDTILVVYAPFLVLKLTHHGLPPNTPSVAEG